MDDEKSLIFGVSHDIDRLILVLLRQKVVLDLENDYYLNIPPPPLDEADEIFGDSVISGIFVIMNEDLIDKLLSWLAVIDRRGKERPKLLVSLGGNILKLDEHDLGIVLDVLKDCSKEKAEKLD
ncbi:MAG: hypothetical protein NWF03_05250 [Candidatus Bathyarchaeota archaeon]|nr:hypothetical protein [Candidatus Bathyarchaeota archaeon]